MVAVDADEFTAIEHWSDYGQRGTTPQRRATASDFETKPFELPVTASWDQEIPYSELPKLLLGVLPREMEDRWFIYADGPDAQGNGAIHMYRSWTGYKNFEAKVLMKMDDDGEVKEDIHFTEITWESDSSRLDGMTEEGAKEMAKAVCNSCMDIKLP